MKSFFIYGLILLFPELARATPNLASYFSDGPGCFLLFDAVKQQTVVTHGGKTCEQRLPACSTFKVPLSLIAFEKGLLLDENTIIKWNGTRYGMPAWNKDQSAASWMRESVVWVSQRLTGQLARSVLEKYLKEFGFGTADMSGGMETAWLTRGTPEKPASNPTLLVSPAEQVRFLARLWNRQLGLKERAYEMTQKILFQEVSPNGYELYGKTGSGFLSEEPPRLGWYVAYLRKGPEAYVAVLSFQSAKEPQNQLYPGSEARERLKRILSELRKF